MKMKLKAYLSLTKPGILIGNLITAAAGFALVSKGKIDLQLLAATLAGLACIMASGCILNNYVDRFADAKMGRTKNRPLPSGAIPLNHALMFGVLLSLIGTAILAAFTNWVAIALSLGGFFIYVVIYTFLKYRTHHATLLGSFAGASPPLVGCAAACTAFEPSALILFAIVALWQMPHFFSIGIYRRAEYAAAAIPILPLAKGLHVTKMQILFYIVAFMAAAASLTLFGYAGMAFLLVSQLLGLAWLFLAWKGFKAGTYPTKIPYEISEDFETDFLNFSEGSIGETTAEEKFRKAGQNGRNIDGNFSWIGSKNETRWAHQMFLFSLVVITLLSGLIFFNAISTV